MKLRKGSNDVLGRIIIKEREGVDIFEESKTDLLSVARVTLCSCAKQNNFPLQ